MKNLLILSVTVCALMLGGCGTKPSTPEEATNAKSYPSVKTDPAPRGGAGHTLPNRTM